ncbi:M14 family metallopeptidase [Romboutsia sp. 1001713B170207_170306_H8]|uniref:M14 family metallopeptidase n=1 Tax=Romboutsia sp. 1001713B170207_170306_H8 TaxID=2787112 RepID=UPI001896D445|nr:M14 family metallopeptidase [Romboutsia sp. 1001713B170207_170306_H8]
MNQELVISELRAKAGEKKQGLINILDTKTQMPITIINGKNDGNTVLITAGVHGCEYPCIKTAIELAKEIDPQKVSGSIIIVHPVNTQGFIGRNAAIVPEDNKNILRVFPGDKNGTISEKIAYFITNELISKADFYFDIHGGDLHEDLVPHIYYPGMADSKVMEKSIKLAKHFNVEYFVKSNTTNGSYTSAAINKNIPSLLIERGSCGLCKDDDVKAYKKDMLNILSVLDILNYNKTDNDCTPKEIKEAKYLDSLSEGCWTCFVKAGESVKKGEKLGEITDYFGNVLDTYYADFDGVVLYNTVAFSVTKGSSLVAYGRI